MSQTKSPILIIGSGLTGLSAAIELEKRGYSCLILEKENQIGGKIQTDLYQDKYLLDHGFQVLLPAYSEFKQLLPKLNLDLKYFHAGALVNVKGQIHKIADPLRHPLTLASTAFGNYGSLKDKLLILKLKTQVSLQDETVLLKASQQGTSLDYLKNYGFSEMMIENFWKPFFSGIFLESDLNTRSGFLLFLYKMFSASPVAVPSHGLGVLTQKMAGLLKNSEIITNSEVKSFDSKKVITTNDVTYSAEAVIQTTSASTDKWGSVCTLYYVAPESPIHGPWLYLNSRKNNSLINHIAVMTEGSKDYSMTNESLISVNLVQGQLGTNDLKLVISELENLFGSQVKHWKFLRAYKIPKALPLSLEVGSNPLDTPSQQGALLRGKNLVQNLNL